MNPIRRGIAFEHMNGGDEAIDPELLIQPPVINGLAHDIFSANAQQYGEYVLTPPVEVVTDTEGSVAFVSLGKPSVDPSAYPRQYPDYALYVTDAEGKTLQPWVIFEDRGNRQITDGAQNEITEPDQLQFVRNTLLTIDAQLAERALAIVQAFEPEQYFLHAVEDEVGRITARLTELEKVRSEVASGKKLTLRTCVKSGWEDEGETSTKRAYELNGGAGQEVAEALEASLNHFKIANGRRDVQGWLEVTLECGAAWYAVENSVWGALFQQRSREGVIEKMALGYAIRDAKAKAEADHH